MRGGRRLLGAARFGVVYPAAILTTLLGVYRALPGVGAHLVRVVGLTAALFVGLSARPVWVADRPFVSARTQCRLMLVSGRVAVGCFVIAVAPGVVDAGPL